MRKLTERTRAAFPAFMMAALCIPAAAHAQAAQPRPAQPAQSGQPVPGELELAKLVWSTMAMIDHANKSGNYSVLRDSSATGFQSANNPAALAEIFAGLRATRIDLSNTLVLAPNYTIQPQMVRPDIFRVQGLFPLRPRAIAFDFYFQWQQGEWRLFGVSVEPREIGGVAQSGQARQSR